MLRALIPSWRFFGDDPGDAVLLELRTATAAGFGPWREAFGPPPPRRWTSLFVNAEGNHRLALHGLVHRLAAEESPVPGGTVSYALVESWVRARARSEGAVRFQFRLREGPAPLLLSPELGT